MIRPPDHVIALFGADAAPRSLHVRSYIIVTRGMSGHRVCSATRQDHGAAAAMPHVSPQKVDEDSMVSQALRPILVVDDDADIRAAIHEALADLGYEVYEAPGGKPALERLRASERGMVVLVDYRMPGMNGIQMIQTIAAHDDLALRHTCVLVTAHYDSLPYTVVTLLQSLGVSVLAKPFDLNDLVVAVQAGERALDGGARAKPIPSDADTGGFLNTQM